MGERPLTTLLTIGLVLFLAWLWREKRLGKLLAALLSAPMSGAASIGPPAPTDTGRRRSGGGILEGLDHAGRDVWIDRPPDDTPVPGSPGTRPGGTWTPRWLTPYPNNELLRSLN